MSNPIEAQQQSIPRPGAQNLDQVREQIESSIANKRAASGAQPLHLPTDAKARKAIPIVTGCFDYFPDALAEVAELSRIGNDQHNPGQPLHWSKDKSTDHADCIGRHMLDRGTRDTDKVRHSTKVAWRALAQLQIEIETERRQLGE